MWRKRNDPEQVGDYIRQKQEAGNYSTNILAKNISITGISVSEARQIALDVFKDNALKLAGIARGVFEKRGREFIDRYLEELAKRKPQALNSLSEPDMQYALFTAQREYARSGDLKLFDLLVDILVDRAAETNRNLQQIVLNESIAIAPKLTSQQFDILSVVFILRYAMRSDIHTLADFDAFLNSTVAPFSAEIPSNSTPYRHLQFAGCVTEGNLDPIPELLPKSYPTILCRGFSREAVAAITPDINFLIGKFLIPCYLNPTQLQVRNPTYPHDDVDVSISPYAQVKLRELHQSCLISRYELRDYLAQHSPESEKLIFGSESSPLGKMALTSVGLAIGIANIRRRTGQDADLANWLA